MIGQKVITCQTDGTYSATPTCKRIGGNLIILLLSSISGNLKDFVTCGDKIRNEHAMEI